MKSGRDNDKFAACKLHAAPGSVLTDCPILEESPVNLECKVTQVIPLGSHDLFLAEVVACDVDESLLDENGKLCLEKAKLIVYSHGEYLALGKKLGTFGYSVQLLGLLHNGRHQHLGQNLVAGKLGGEPAAALRGLPDKGGKVCKLCQRHLGNDGLQAVLVRLHAQHTATALGHITHDIAGVVVGHMGLQGVDRLQNDGAGLRHSGFIGQLCSHDKGHFRAIHGVVAAVQQGGLQADHGITGQHALFGGKADTLFHSREEVLGHAAAEHLFLEHDLLAVAGLKVDDNVTELAMTAGLLLVAALFLAGLADRLAVGDAGSFQTDLHAELVLQLGLDHIQMLLAQATNDLLMGLGVIDVAQGGVLFHQACQCAGDLALVALLWPR